MKPQSLLVIDLGGTSAKFAAIRNGNPLPDTRQFPTAALRTGDPVENLARLIDTVSAEFELNPEAVVSSVPGFLDPDRDLVRFAGNIPEFNGRRLASELRARTSIPVILERDSILSLRGEWWAGAGRNVQNLLGLFFGTGVGGAFLEDGKPFRGSGFSLEIGSMPFKGEGRELSGMRTDCLEAYVSGRVLSNIANRHKVPIHEIFLNTDKQSELEAELDNFLKDMAIAIGIAFSLFSPDVVVLGGGVCEMAGFPSQRLRILVAANATTHEMGVDLDLRFASLGWGAVLKGAEMTIAEYILQ